ncbi:MAG: hypothetical protein KDL87_09805 [Verrucomicrobiae bacterium]|nr:hypothetical protein [Verrucomicrobiae bacterium]
MEPPKASHPPQSAFTRWAHDPARSIDERYLVWLLCEHTARIWHWRLPPEERKAIPFPATDLQYRKVLHLNPALVPPYSVSATERAAEMAPYLTNFEPNISILGDKPIHDAGALRFFPALETVRLGASRLHDLAWVSDLPRLRALQVTSGALEDLSPLATATGLRELSLLLETPVGTEFAPPHYWPDTSPLAGLTRLESLVFGPNAGALAGLRFPSLRVATLACAMQRDCLCLPEMPELMKLDLSGVQSLRGIGRVRNLRNLAVSGPLRDFGDLPALRHLTALEVDAPFGWPRDVDPVAALPELRYVRFGNDTSHYREEVPRNYWPLAGASRLRQLEAPGAIGIALDLQAIQAALTPWDVDFLAPTPRPLPPLRFVARREYYLLQPESPALDPDYLADREIFFRESLWMYRRCRERLVALTGHDDTVGDHRPTRHTTKRVVRLTIEGQALADRLPEAVDALRQCLAEAKHEWYIDLSIHLRVPKRLFSEQQRKWLEELEAGWNREDDEAEYERRRAVRRHEIEATHRLRSTLEDGETPEPGEFAPPEEVGPTGRGQRETVVSDGGAARDSDDDASEETDDEIPEEFRLRPYDEQEKEREKEDDEGSGDPGDLSVKVDYGPPDWFIEDPNAHPLNWTYRMLGKISLDTFCAATHCQGTAESLMGRPVDQPPPDPVPFGSESGRAGGRGSDPVDWAGPTAGGSGLTRGSESFFLF